MKILNAEVEWFEEFDNHPTLKILVDKIPEVTYEQKGNMYWGESGGFVSFYYYERPDRGFGGHTFNVTMKDGNQKALIGPWSSSCSQMNNFFPASKPVSITDSQKVWERGYTFFGGNILLTHWMSAIDEFCEDAHYVSAQTNSAVTNLSDVQNNVLGHGPVIETYEIARRGMPFETSQQYKRAARFLRMYNKTKENMWLVAFEEALIKHNLCEFF